MTCNLLSSFLKGNLDTIELFQAFFDQIVWHAVGTQRRPGALIRSDIVMILACLDLSHVWNLAVYLLDHVGVSPQQRTILIVTDVPVDERIGLWNV